MRSRRPLGAASFGEGVFNMPNLAEQSSGAFRVGRESDEWWVSDRLSYTSYASFWDMPEAIRARVLVLMRHPVGYSESGIGRYICHERFWIYLSKQPVLIYSSDWPRVQPQRRRRRMKG
jgi:hypothetical protein